MVNHHIPNCWNKGFYIMDPSKYGKNILKTASALVWASLSSSAWKCHLLVLRTPLAFGPQCIICNWIGPKISSPWHLRAFPLWAGTLFALVIGLNGGHRKSFVIISQYIVHCWLYIPIRFTSNFPIQSPINPAIHLQKFTAELDRAAVYRHSRRRSGAEKKQGNDGMGQDARWINSIL